LVVSLSDLELIQRYKSTEDLKVVGTLYHRYTHLVAVLCMKYLKNRADSEDAAMEIFEVLIKDLKHYEVQNFKAWLFTVVRNHCFKRLRIQQREKDKEREFQKRDNSFMETDTIQDLEGESDTIQRNISNLQEALDSLKSEQRECIQLFYLKEKSYKKVVEVTGYDIKKVKSYIQNGKRNLAIYFNKIDK
jgi:RNA polymerase sigma-70 factor (ECF subfamily)